MPTLHFKRLSGGAITAYQSSMHARDLSAGSMRLRQRLHWCHDCVKGGAAIACSRMSPQHEKWRCDRLLRDISVQEAT